MSSLPLVWHVKCMPCQPSRFPQVRVTKDARIDEWHVSKIYKHMFDYESSHMSKNQPSLA
jgi:hypothetical protein